MYIYILTSKFIDVFFIYMHMLHILFDSKYSYTHVRVYMCMCILKTFEE